jgi:predicted transcriptional regulator
MSAVPDRDETLSRLFGSVSRARILELLLSHSGRAFYQREIMYETGLSLQPTQRELKNLSDLGIIKKRETAEKVYYEIDTLSPFFKPLCEIFGSFTRMRGKGDRRP